ncbi:uncharacterized protein [Miscanthus floridulus]|uniref:uncharacterized protein isoform X2 n=1 Tax=Miscanthus floridulus TaxID=154761 RepID=UPI003459948F
MHAFNFQVTPAESWRTRLELSNARLEEEIKNLYEGNSEGLDGRLAAEMTKSRSLEKELGEVEATLLKESDEHDLLRAAVGVVFNDLEVTRPEGTSSLAACAVDITARVRQLEENVFHAGITQAFAIARSHYAESIDLETMSLGFAPDYEDFELDEIEKAVTPIARNLADRMKDIVLPQRG